MPEVDLDLVRHALSVARDKGFLTVDLQVESGSFTATLERVPKKKKASVATSSPDLAPSGPEPVVVKAGYVGYFHDADEPIEAGQTIEPGDVVGVITVLGIANDVESQVSGEVLEVLVGDGDPVEYGQPLIKVLVS